MRKILIIMFRQIVYRIGLAIIILIALCSPVFCEPTSIDFFAKGTPSLGIYHQEFLPTYVNKDKELTNGYNKLVEFRFQEAEAVLKKVANDKKRENGPRSEANAYLGYIYLNQLDLDRAKECLYKAVQQDENNSLAYFFLANVYFFESDFQKTREQLFLAIKYRPNFIAAMRMLAETYNNEHNLKESAKYYKQIIQLLPKSGYYHYQYYKIVNQMNDYKEVEKTLKSMIAIQPRFLPNKIHLGENYIRMGRLDEAMKEFDEVIASDPNNSLAYEGRAKIFLEKQDYDGAVKEAETAKKIDPGNTYINSIQAEIKDKKAERNRYLLTTVLLAVLALAAVWALVYFIISHRQKLYILDVIQKFNRTVDEIYDIEKLSSFILSFFLELGGSKKGQFLIFNRHNNQLSVKASLGIDDESLRSFSLFAGEEITNWLSGLKRYLLSREDVNRDELFDAVFPSLKERFSEMGLTYILPLREKNNLVGIVALDEFQARLKNTISNENALFMPLSTTSAQAVSNLTLYETTISDETTGMFNKRHFRQSLSTELKRSERYKQPVSLLTLDIDNFKRINDTYGHPQGDLVLKELGIVMRKTFREGIDVGARVGGEEFSAILPATDSDNSRIAAERLRFAVENHKFSGFPEGSGQKVTVSLGLATYPTHATSDMLLIKNSDEALYQAKRTGKNRVCVFGQAEEADLAAAQGAPERAKPIPATLADETGLYSRAYFDERYFGEVRRSERNFRPCSLLLIEPDNKLAKGERDNLFKNIGEILFGNLRRGIDIPARFDKSIIAILLPETDHNRAAQIARRMKALIDTSKPLSGEQRITFSIGVSNYPDLGRTDESFMDAARQSLKICHNLGGDQAMIASPI
jgi:diguanylate cyclase (GGDEF)-like protein